MTLMESLAECLLAMPVCDAQWTDSPWNNVARDDVTTHDSQRAALPSLSARDAYLFHPKFLTHKVVTPSIFPPFITINSKTNNSWLYIMKPPSASSSRLLVTTRFFASTRPKLQTRPGASASLMPC